MRSHVLLTSYSTCKWNKFAVNNIYRLSYKEGKRGVIFYIHLAVSEPKVGRNFELDTIEFKRGGRTRLSLKLK